MIPDAIATSDYWTVSNRGSGPVCPLVVRRFLMVSSLLVFVVWPASLFAQPAVTPLPTSQTVLLGRFAQGPCNLPQWVGPAEFAAVFGSTNSVAWPAELQARQYFANGGSSLFVVRVPNTGSLFDALTGDSNMLTGLYAVLPLSNVRLMLAPELGLLNAGEFATALASFRTFCDAQGVFLILDPPPGLNTATAMIDWAAVALPRDASGCAVYYPYLQIQLDGSIFTAPASGAMASIYVRNDVQYGIWHAPAGTGFPLTALGTSPILNTADSDALNVANIDSIRIFSGTGVVPWGARTLDLQNPENLYVPVVRTRAWIAACLHRSLAFTATNDDAEPLWSQIRNVTEDFLHTLYLQGAFVGTTSSQAYFVRCDSTTTTASDVLAHRVNLVYGFAPLRPAEFVITTVALSTYNPQRKIPSPNLYALAFEGNLQFAYPIEPGLNYTLESASDLASGQWTAVGSVVAGDGAWVRPAVATSGERAFYRLQITRSQ